MNHDKLPATAHISAVIDMPTHFTELPEHGMWAVSFGYGLSLHFDMQQWNAIDAAVRAATGWEERQCS